MKINRIALGAWLSLGPAAFADDGGPVVSTEVIRAAPHVAGTPAAGSCWEASEVTPRPGAFRCKVGNQVIDPCFSDPHDAKRVSCVDTPDQPSRQMIIALDSPLPKAAPEQPIHPWFLVLEDGTRCGFVGAASGIPDPRINYQCLDGRYLLGDPKPGSPWTASVIRLAATKGPPGGTPVAIRKLWY
jgi:hypothetical protein